MAHRTEHIYSNLIGTLGRHHPLAMPQNKVEVPAAPQVVQESSVLNRQEQTVCADGLSYIEAIQAAKDGERVRRSEWSEGIYVFVEDGTRIMKCTEGNHLPSKAVVDKLTPLVSDVLSSDWLVIPLPCCTFQEAVVAMEQGQYVRRFSWSTYIQIRDGKFYLLDDSPQEYTMRYEDVCTSDWEIIDNSAK